MTKCNSCSIKYCRDIHWFGSRPYRTIYDYVNENKIENCPHYKEGVIMKIISRIKEYLNKEEILEQIVYDEFFSNECPICKQLVEKQEHYSDDVGLMDKTIMECPKCHIALWGKRIKLNKILKKYKKDEDAIMGLKLISEEIIKTEGEKK